jgi:hypothetical protein
MREGDIDAMRPPARVGSQVPNLFKVGSII